MSRYVIEGVLRDLADGKNVVITGPRLREAEDLHRQIVAAADEKEWQRIVRANGNASATHFGGGMVRPVASTASLRGRRVDVLLVMQPRLLTEDQVWEVRGAAGATGAEVQEVL
ncbi:hypothetical protein [Brachybacterium phenoliresistens]|uniref:hypothetical protein n=1 Tax=Brachybacterium phenoliresistens TaxID=396014 RepID=UPI0031D853E6